jgi:hypothetical protein
MRIEGYIEHSVLKITVFQMNNRLSVKFESGLYELVYKFRQGSGIEKLEDVKQLVDREFLNAVEQQMQDMHRNAMTALQKRQGTDQEETFEEIL